MTRSLHRRAALAVARAGLPLWRILRPASRRGDGRGSLLGAQDRRTVILVWATDTEGAEARVAALSDVLAMFDLAVIVLDDYPAAVALGELGEIVVLPDRDTAQRFYPEADWELWTKRRKAQIRHDWAPDFEIDIGAQAAQEAAQTASSG